VEISHDDQPQSSRQYPVPLKLELLSENLKVMQELLFTVIGICPGQGTIRSFPIKESEVGIDSVTKINPVRKILPGCQDETFLTEKSRIDVNLPFSIA